MQLEKLNPKASFASCPFKISHARFHGQKDKHAGSSSQKGVFELWTVDKNNNILRRFCHFEKSSFINLECLTRRPRPQAPRFEHDALCAWRWERLHECPPPGCWTKPPDGPNNPPPPYVGGPDPRNVHSFHPTKVSLHLSPFLSRSFEQHFKQWWQLGKKAAQHGGCKFSYSSNRHTRNSSDIYTQCNGFKSSLSWTVGCGGRSPTTLMTHHLAARFHHVAGKSNTIQKSSWLTANTQNPQNQLIAWVALPVTCVMCRDNETRVLWPENLLNPCTEWFGRRNTEHSCGHRHPMPHRIPDQQTNGSGVLAIRSKILVQSYTWVINPDPFLHPNRNCQVTQ